ncbi:hypothetical protein AVEN_156976-1 [Araneus ventricosus]|uniref:Uncharacterized protein n=1 Tax=Araneus ventricosus TaxID=182803 RepID=A0A4Y2HL08_ARAVE|nr:hypothetical protein AVEN_156976-1 [Araneus ventricosus]
MYIISNIRSLHNDKITKKTSADSETKTNFISPFPTLRRKFCPPITSFKRPFPGSTLPSIPWNTLSGSSERSCQMHIEPPQNRKHRGPAPAMG